MGISVSTRQLRAVLRHNIVEDPAVYAICEGRVLSSHGVDSENVTREHPAVILDLRGGSDFAQAPVGRREVHVYAYSNRNGDEALDLYEAVKEVLQRSGLTGRLDENGDPCEDVCAYGYEEEGPLESYNQLVHAWFVRGTWRVWALSSHLEVP